MIDRDITPDGHEQRGSPVRAPITDTRWYRVHSGGLVEEIIQTRHDWFEAAIGANHGVRRVIGRSLAFDGAEILCCRHLHSIDHWRCTASCQLEWVVGQIDEQIGSHG